MDYEKTWEKDRLKLGKVKNYLRFSHHETFGLVVAGQVGSDIEFLNFRGTTNRFVTAIASESVYVWDTKTKEVVQQFFYHSDNTSEVSAIRVHNGGHQRTNLIAVGYVDGKVRVYEYETGTLRSTFTGHRKSISALAFDKTGGRLASGSKEGLIVIWDIFGEKGLYCLKGHRNSITQVEFLFNEEFQRDILVSSSVDTVSAIKLWDLAVQHCFKTISGNVSGVWSFLLLRENTRLILGTSSSELKVYSIQFVGQLLAEEENKNASLEVDEDDENVQNSKNHYGVNVTHMGNILRNNSDSTDRLVNMKVDAEESLLICHSTKKVLEVYGLRNQSDALTYARKRIKKAAKRNLKRKERDNNDNFETNDPPAKTEQTPLTSLESLDPQTIIECEINRKLGSYKLLDRIKAVSLTKLNSKNNQTSYKIAIGFSTNRLATYQFNECSSENSLDLCFIIEQQSHKSDVRSVAISTDCKTLISTSAESMKIWNLESQTCIGTVETEYATSCVFANPQSMLDQNRDRKFAIISTKQGNIQIIDLQEAQVVETIKVCADKSLNYLSPAPNGAGIVCGGEDKVVRFFDYAWVLREDEDGKRKSLCLEESRALEFQEGITCVKISANMKFLAVGLLDSTVRIHYIDTLKYFLTLYGHKFPVVTLDISDDSTLIVTGSPDKNIKIWGMDFGDCHKSIFAHDEAITCVKFVPRTHHVFSCSLDRTIKQWDCDKFIRIQALRRHQAEVWCLDVSVNGKTVVTASHDKSLRLYRKTEEIVVPEVEEETEREQQDEINAFEHEENIVPGEASIETGFALKSTVESVKSTDRLMEAIDVFVEEQEKEIAYKKECKLYEEKGKPKPPKPEYNPLLVVAQTDDYRLFMLEIIRRIPSSDLEEILITLPFDYVRKLLVIVVIFIDRGWDLELMTRAATFLLRINFGPMSSCRELIPPVSRLREVILERTCDLRDLAGFNLLALEHLKNRVGQTVSVE